MCKDRVDNRVCRQLAAEIVSIFAKTFLEDLPDFPVGQKRGVEVCMNCLKDDGLEGRLQLCGRCKVGLYCSRECQLADFPHHKAECRTWTKPQILYFKTLADN